MEFGSAIKRHHSLSYLRGCDAKARNPVWPLAGRSQRGTNWDPGAPLTEGLRRKREAGGACCMRKLELDLDIMHFELFSLKQKMESSMAHLEKETKWLEVMARGEGRKEQKGPNQIFHLEKELAKAACVLGTNGRGLQSSLLESTQTAAAGEASIGQELRTLQERLAAQKEDIKALRAKRDEVEQQLKSAKEVHPAEQPEKMPPHEPIQQLILELEHAQREQEKLNDQVSALHLELISTRAQVSHQEKEKALWKEEMDSLVRKNQELTSEAGESIRRLEESLEKLHQLEVEKKIQDSRIEALETERSQLLGDRDGRPSQRWEDGGHHGRELADAQESCAKARESQVLLQKETEFLKERCLGLEAVLQAKPEEMGNELEKQQIFEYWRDRWQQVTTDLKTKEEDLERMYTQNQTFSAKADDPQLRQNQPDASEQERDCSQALVQLLRSGNENWPGQTHEVQITPSAKEAEAELAIVREELQKALDSLKTRDTELEQVQQELESTRGQYAECISEKQRLGKVVLSLEERIAEKERALRHLQQAKETGRAELEMNISTLELKGQAQGSDANAIRSPQGDLENLKQQHQLVTEQLKDLFRQKQKRPRRGHGESSETSQKCGGTLASPGSDQLAESHQAFLSVPGKDGEAHALRQQLEEKNNTISSMASEIQILKEKNENLTKAKLRFQQQIQEIRRLSTQQPGKSNTQQDLQRANTSETSAPLPQRDEPITASSQSSDNLPVATGGAQLCPKAETKSGCGSSDTGAVPLSSASPAAHKIPLSTLPLESDSEVCNVAPPSIRLDPADGLPEVGWQAENDRAAPSAQGSALLSPRPFGSQRPWSPFKFRGNPETLEN